LNFHIFIIGYKTCLLFSHRCFFTTMSLSKQPLKETYHHYRHSLTVVVVVVAKPIIQRALRQSHANGAATLKLYGYIGIGNRQVFGVCQNYSARGVRGGRGAPNINLGPPIISETT